MIESTSSITSSPAAAAPSVRSLACELHVSWHCDSSLDPAGDFAIAVCSYFDSRGAELVASTQSGRIMEGMNLEECASFIRRDESFTLTLHSDLGEWQLAVSRPRQKSETTPQCTLRVMASLDDAIYSNTVWLQSNFSHLSPIPLIAIQMTPTGPSLSSFHNLVVLASRFGRLENAELMTQSEHTQRLLIATWTCNDPIDGAVPIYSYEQDALCLATPESPSTIAKPLCWLMPASNFIVNASQPTSTWRQTFAEVLNAKILSEPNLLSHIQALGSASFPVTITSLSEVSTPRTMTPIHDGLSCLIIPMQDGVSIAIDFELDRNVLGQTLLHAYGHVLLGHVRPGDEFAHWETSDTVTAVQPFRRWDREVREHFSAWFEPEPERCIESLNDCSPLEKAKLGLWRMIGEVLGESKQLHPVAERYQKAAYQRQAAQRMVSMLEDFGGAMLCDGVGLGKTYVATTLMVHYANIWRERHKDNPDSLLTDPFRITVLSPNSVVSTWRREAIPPLVSFGLPLSSIRVISHSKLSRITNNSDILQIAGKDKISDLEHLLLSDLVIVDEAHNFRSVSAGRTKVLRDLLRIQPRRDIRRRVALLTATPINNSLDDLRQQTSLLFSKPLWISDARSEEGYRRQALRTIEERCQKARSTKASKLELSGMVIHGQPDARFSDAIEFRDDLDFGPSVQRIGDYLKEQDKKLKLLQSEIRATARQESSELNAQPVRIAEELLDRIVVQRSRNLCKNIERQQGSHIELLFRPDQLAPEKLYYSDEYDGIQDVLARFLPLFDGQRHSDQSKTVRPLSLKVYMWHDLQEGIKSIDESSPVVGLQRVLVLKRLESSPVSFLITLLRLLVLHAHRLQQLSELCRKTDSDEKMRLLNGSLEDILNRQSEGALEKLRMLATGEPVSDARTIFFQSLSKSYSSGQGASDTDDPPPRQLSLFGDDEETITNKESLDRLWPLREHLLEDLQTLFEVTPALADIVFGRFDKDEWPRGFITGGVQDSDWPLSPSWGLRLVKDAKLRSLVRRLLEARREGRKAIVFTQFSDTISYIESVLRACRRFSREEWQVVTRGIGLENLKKEEVIALLDTLATVTGATEDRDEVVNAFAPFYRIGPHRPVTERLNEIEQKRLIDDWTAAWRYAIENPRDVLISTDVLAEGVNLQDVSLLINFDIHWNPVRMIQRAGRIDRRLNPSTEKNAFFSELASLAKSIGKPAPTYYYHSHPQQAPITVNMILPDELEAELQLRERIATKTLAIDFTLGLEQGTGAEADWMQDYKYQGISSLNSFQKDRAIEQVAGHYEKLSTYLRHRGIVPGWSDELHGWFRASTASESSPLIGRAQFGRQGSQMGMYSRYLEPQMAEGTPCWLWSQKKPADSILNFWLCLDNESFPARTRADLRWSEQASSPITAHHLLAATQALEAAQISELPVQDIGRPLMQGITALSAGFLGTEADRRAIQIAGFFLLQLESFAITSLGSSDRQTASRRGLAKQCQICGHEPGMHKCCSHCKKSATTEPEVERLFGFRRMTDSHGTPYEVPQPWCRECRKSDHE